MPEEGSDELSQLGREVNQMSETVKRMQAEAVEREKFAAVGQVVRRLTHNIRNPLAGIRSLAETSRDESPADSDVRDAQERIITTVDRFDQWLTDFLKATNPHRVEPRETSVGEWLDACLGALGPMAESAGVRLERRADGAPESAVFDPVQMEQALVAIVTNAVEVTPRGGRVEVVAASNGSRWTIAVEDDGPGVAPELAERLFEADYTTKPGGHGIGLTAARWIVRRHDGMIGVSRAGRGAGARFEITLPLAAASAPAGESPEPPTGED
jgi:signal transduction histidine kinase